MSLAEPQPVGLKGSLRRFKQQRITPSPPRRRRARPAPKRSTLKEAVLIGPRGQVVCERCYVADRSLPRVRGLIGWRRLKPTEGMLLRPSWSIHTAFVRFPIDVVFLDGQLKVLSVKHRFKPWNAAFERRAHSVLELSAGRCEQLGIAPGDVLAWGWL
jgi:uncharacterized membrane protein (UPF0127 family)